MTPAPANTSFQALSFASSSCRKNSARCWRGGAGGGGAPRGPVNRRAIGGLHGLCRFRQGPAAASTWLDPADPGLVRPRATFLSCLGEPGTVSPEPKHLSDRLSQVEASAVPPRVVTAGRGWDSVGVLEGRSAFGQLGHRLVEAVDDAVVYQAGEQGV